MQLPRGYHRRTVFAEASGGTRTSRSGPALTLRVVFSLPLRQNPARGLSPWRHPPRPRGGMGLNLKAPDHTTLSRRNQIVAVPPLTRSQDGPIDLIVDSTGLKILGCGEWFTRTSTRHQRNAGIGGSCTSGWMPRGSLWRPNSQRAAGTTPPHSLLFSTQSRFPSARRRSRSDAF